MYQPWAESEKYGLKGKFIVLYLGNAGAGHEFDTLLKVADALRDDPIIFFFVGGGSRWSELARAKEQRGLANILLHGYVPKEQTGALMAECGAACITLRNEAAGLISPSKLHAYLALGMPVLYIGPRGSNVDEAITAHGVGVSVRVGDVTGAAAFLRLLLMDSAIRASFRVKARAAFDNYYNDFSTLPQFDTILDSLAAKQPSGRRVSQ
jgi:glycosyltransferase involved in cell wall biosynthesis